MFSFIVFLNYTRSYLQADALASWYIWALYEQEVQYCSWKKDSRYCTYGFWDLWERVHSVPHDRWFFFSTCIYQNQRPRNAAGAILSLPLLMVELAFFFLVFFAARHEEACVGSSMAALVFLYHRRRNQEINKYPYEFCPATWLCLNVYFLDYLFAANRNPVIIPCLYILQNATFFDSLF